MKMKWKGIMRVIVMGENDSNSENDSNGNN